jgi:hypothetical protein
MKNCPNCANENSDDSTFCRFCGAPLALESQTPEPAPVEIAKPEYEEPVALVPPAVPVAPPPPAYIARSAKDKSLALILEILPGLFGILGIGWIYAGNTTAGLIWLIAFLFWDVIAVTIAVFTVGIGILCTFPINILCIVISVVSLNNYTKQHPELFK